MTAIPVAAARARSRSTSWPASRAKGRSSSSWRAIGPPRCGWGSSSRRASSRRCCAGASHLEAPDITSRICGICPAAYLLSACHAMEDALGIRVGGALRDLRRLLYFGEWIESHTLHAFLLHAPDFLGYPDALTMAKTHGDWVKKGLRIKRAGNDVMERLGGREIHPINVQGGRLLPGAGARRAGGAAPRAALGTRGRRGGGRMGLRASPTPRSSATTSSCRCATRTNIRSARGGWSRRSDWTSTFSDYERHFVEQQVPHSNALHSRVVGRGACLSGPLARFNLCFDRLSPAVQALARPAGGDAADQEPVSRPAGSPAGGGAGVRRVDRDHRALSTAGRALRRRAPARRGRLRRHRGAARVSLPPLRARRGRGRSSMPASCLPRRETSWPSRKTSTRWRRSSRPCPMKARPTARSRPSAITTRASRARRTFSTLRMERG